MSSRPNGGRDVPAYILLALCVVILGFNWPLMAIGVDRMGPLWLTATRLTGGALFVTTVRAITGSIRHPPRQDLPVVLSIAVIRLLLVLGVVLTALVFVPPGRSAVLVWTASLWTVPLAAIFLQESMTTRRWWGLAAGIAGIVVLVEPWSGSLSAKSLLGYGLLLIGAVANAATAVHVRGHRWESSPLDLLPWQLVIASIPAFVMAFVVEGPPTFQWTPLVIVVVIYQATLATGLALWSEITVLQRLPSIPTNLTLMLVPVVGVVSSAALLGDDLTTPVIVGGLLIAAGVLTGVERDEIF